MLKTLLITLLGLLMVASFTIAGDEEKKTEDVKAVEAQPVEEAPVAKKADQAEAETPAEPEIITNPSGLRYQDLVVGEGKEAVKGMRVECHYTLWLADSTGLGKGKRLQSSKDRGKTFECKIGYRLIQGWSEGMEGMKEGGTRLLFVPWRLGYGERGMGAMIPGKSDLVFEIEFVKAL